MQGLLFFSPFQALFVAKIHILQVVGSNAGFLIPIFTIFSDERLLQILKNLDILFVTKLYSILADVPHIVC